MVGTSNVASWNGHRLLEWETPKLQFFWICSRGTPVFRTPKVPVLWARISFVDDLQPATIPVDVDWGNTSERQTFGPTSVCSTKGAIPE